DEAQRTLDTLEHAFTNYTAFRDSQQIPLLRKGNVEAAKNLSLGTQFQSFKSLKEGAAQLAEHAQKIGEERAHMARLTCIGVGLFAILVAVIL
ncbi:hypothetical protein ACO1NL_13955, partial [Staphylococcus aureus]